MNYIFRFAFFSFLIIGIFTMSYSKRFISADNPDIQYYGRWDMTDPLHPRHSWPGIYISLTFNGTSISIRMSDSINYYNVYIDGEFVKIVHGTKTNETDYLLADNLKSGYHTLLFSKRNIVFDAVFSISGFLLDDNAEISAPPEKPVRKIEFIGDSFTAAESNEATVQELSWEERFPVTNIDKGFAPIIARYFKAQYHTICRSGSGMICDWQGKTDAAIPKLFDRALMELPNPKWNFNQWIPDLVVICLGLNDLSGLKDKEGNVSEEKSAAFRKGYHDFIDTLRNVYPGSVILAVAAFPDWIKRNVKRIVDEERWNGVKNIYYTFFDDFPEGEVAYGHPTVESHKKIADQLINSIEQINLFPDSKEY